MKNKLKFLFNSFKQSIINKPIAFVFLILIFFAMTCCCSLPSRYAVSEIRDEYSREASLSFDIKINKFSKYKDDIFDCFETKEKELNAYDEMDWSIGFDQYKCNVKINNIDNKFDSVFVTLSKFRQEESAGYKNVCEIGEYEAKQYGIVEGDSLQLYGIDFVVTKIYVGKGGICIPYDTDIKDWYSFESPPDPHTGKTKKARIIGSASGISREELNNLSQQLWKFGCKRGNTGIVPLTNSFVIVFAMLLIGMVASTSILHYWLKCNNKKYATFKTLGCSPTMLAIAVIIETMLIAILAIGLGLIVDIILSVTMQETIVIAGYEWIHYLMLIGAPLFSIMIVTIIAVCKRAIAMPADTKYNS